MAMELPFGSENYAQKEEDIEYIDVEIRELPEDIEVDIMYNSFGMGDDDKLYMGTCCTFGSAYILCYDSIKDKIEVVANMDEVINDYRNGYDRQGKIHGPLFLNKNGKIYGTTHQDIGIPYYGNFYDPGQYLGGHWFCFDPNTWQVEDLGLGKEGEGFLTNTLDIQGNILYAVTWPGGYLYSYDINSGVSRNLGRTSIHLSRFMLCMSDGTVYYSMKDGYLGRYQRGEDCIKSIPYKIQPPEETNQLSGNVVLQCAVEWEKRKSFIGFAGNPFLMSKEGNDKYSLEYYHLFKKGIYSCFELVVDRERKIYYSHCEWGEPPLHSARIFRFDPETGVNEMVGYMRCGQLRDIRHICGGAVSKDGSTLYYHALIPKDMRDRNDLTRNRLREEDGLFKLGEMETLWVRKYFKPVLVIYKIKQ